MDVRWLTAFLDLPAERFDAATAFWCRVTGSTRSAFRGAQGEFATLLPPDGDAYLRVQRVPRAPDGGGIHLDLHVDDVAAARDEAVATGATLLHEAGYAVLRSPGGFVFCVVSHHGERQRPQPAGGALVDQVCLDVPPSMLHDEARFWAALTGWEHRPGGFPEFSYLVRPTGMPLRLLIQRLDDDADCVRAHLDLACGDGVEALTAHHVALGARELYRGSVWTTLADPAGLRYCLTRRDPVTGMLATGSPGQAPSR